MRLEAKLFPYRLKFKFSAGTSRGVLTHHDIYIVKVCSPHNPKVFGLGEIAPLPRLSPDHRPEIKAEIEQILEEINTREWDPDLGVLYREILNKVPQESPAITFGLETALLDWLKGGKRQICNNSFSAGKRAIPINGLVWMGDQNKMKKRLEEKLELGFTTIKIKVGGISFAEELELVKQARQIGGKELTLRLDANGAFGEADVWNKLDELAAYDIHSIEQPVMAQESDFLKQVIERSPIPVALDESLISISDKKKLLRDFKPQYIVLKPTLLGGLQQTQEWIDLAKEHHIGWWVTSALESNIGLNAISQFVGNFHHLMPQGLGTGQLYTNNFDSPLTISKGRIFYDASQKWDITPIQRSKV